MIHPPYVPSVSQYKTSLSAVHNLINDKQVALLQAHYNAPNRTITTPQLAQAIGINGFSTVNLQYGRFAHMLCDALNFVPNRRADGTYRWWSILGSGIPSNQEHGFQWVMHEQLAQALEELGWSSNEQFSLPEEIKT